MIDRVGQLVDLLELLGELHVPQRLEVHVQQLQVVAARTRVLDVIEHGRGRVQIRILAARSTTTTSTTTGIS